MKRLMLVTTFVLVAWCPVAVFAQQSGNAHSSGGVGTTMKDSWLTTKTKSRLFADRRVKATAVEVDTENAVVTLRGKVRTAEERKAAEDIARSTAGVKAVANALQIVPRAQRKAVDARDGEIKRAVALKLEGVDGLKEGISVRSDAAVVTLLGTVADSRAQKRATDLVKSVQGVKSVRNELKVKDGRAAKAR